MKREGERSCYCKDLEHVDLDWRGTDSGRRGKAMQTVAKVKLDVRHQVLMVVMFPKM